MTADTAAGPVRAGTVREIVAVDDDEQGEPVWFCAGLRRPRPAVWRSWKDYSG